MEKLNHETEKIMMERFGKDTVIALATEENGTPYVRYVNAVYADRAFYILTYALSGKIRQMEKNPVIAVAGEWFTGHGEGVNMGWFHKIENMETANMMRTAFASWIDNGHNDFNDENTIILCVRLKTGLLFSKGTRYEIDFRI